jgi:5-formyltetrahydrofolate cyclo-ligase
MVKIMTKNQLREQILNDRDHVSVAAVKEKSEKINAFLESLTDFEKIMVFLPTGSECDIWDYIGYLLKEGRSVYAPVCFPHSIIRPALVTDIEKDLEVGKYDILAPKSKGRQYIEDKELDAVIVPGVGFDRKGNRLGFGGGYYDRFLPKTKPTCRKIAVCYELQLKECVFPEEHDFPVDVIVTEDAVYNIR